MAGAAADHKQVPDGVHVGDAVRQVEGDTRGVDNASGDGQVQGGFTQVAHQCRGGKYDQPAHRQIDTHSGQFEAVPEDDLQYHAGDGQGPDHREQCPARGAPHIDQQEGCVSARYQQEDGAMVQGFEQGPEFRVPGAVVERRGQVQEDQ